MDEFKFKFTYNGVDSFLNLMDDIRLNTKADRVGNHWKGIIKLNGKPFIRSEGSYIMAILFKIIEQLDEKKGLLVEMDLYSN